MGIADDFMNAFLKANPVAGEGKLTLPELKKLMASYQDKANSTAQIDFDGLSATQMHILLHAPLSPNSLLRFDKNMEEYLEQVPLFKLSEILLTEIKVAGKLKLTTKGNLPVHICELLFNQHLIDWEYMEYMGKIIEDEIPWLGPLKQYLLHEGIVRKQAGTISLTKKGTAFLQKSKSVRFTNLFLYISSTFHWGNFYRLDDDGKAGQLGWAYSLVLLSKYGDQKRDSQFYSSRLMQAFEKKLWENRDPKDWAGAISHYHGAYTVRFFEFFAHWFGLVNIEIRKDPGISFFKHLDVQKSELFDHLFEPVKY